MDLRITLLALIISSCSPSRIEEDIFSDIEVAKPKIMGDFYNSLRNKHIILNIKLEYPINLI